MGRWLIVTGVKVMSLSSQQLISHNLGNHKLLKEFLSFLSLLSVIIQHIAVGIVASSEYSIVETTWSRTMVYTHLY